MSMTASHGSIDWLSLLTDTSAHRPALFSFIRLADRPGPLMAQSTMSFSQFNLTEFYPNWTAPSGNTSNRRSLSVPEPPLYLIVVLSLLFSFIFIFSITGNVLVTAVVFRGRTLRTSVNYYLISLCIADLLVIIVCMPSAWVDVYAKDVWYFGETLCKMVPYLENVVAGASVYTILCICVERYKAICQPLYRSNEAMCRVVKIVSVIWILSAILSLPFAFFPVYRNSVWLDGTPIKVCRHPMKYSWQKAYLVAIPIIFFLLPLLVLVALYCRVGRVLIPQAGDSGDIFDESYREKMRQRRQGINIVVSIVCIFFICHLPYRVISLWFIFESREVLAGLGLEAYLSILYFARIAFYLNHALNPILYNVVSRKFRAELRWMCRTWKFRLPKCTANDNDIKNSSFKSSRSFSPKIHFRKRDRQSEENPQKLIEQVCPDTPSSTSETRKYRNDFSGLYASIHAADNTQDQENCSANVADVKKHFTGEIKCQGTKKKITSFRLFIQSTGDGIAINVDLTTKRPKRWTRKDKFNASSKMTYI